MRCRAEVVWSVWLGLAVFSAGRLGFFGRLEAGYGIGFVVNKLEYAVETGNAEDAFGRGGGVAKNEPAAGAYQELVELDEAGKT